MPSGEKATSVNASNSETANPVSDSHIRTVLSQDLDVRYFPSGENVIDKTGPVFFKIGPTTVAAVCVSHILIVPSAEQEAIRFPSGEKETPYT
jgi:hypothetical protein